MIVSVRSKRPLWERLTQFIEENYRVKRDFAFYGKNYGWALRFRSGGRALAAFYPGTGSFTVQVIIGQAQLEEASQLRLGAKVRGILRNARAFTEGRWLFIPVESEQDCRDGEHLLTVRANPLKKNQKRNAATRRARLRRVSYRGSRHVAQTSVACSFLVLKFGQGSWRR